MKKKTKKSLLNVVIIVLILAMLFGGVGSVIFAIYYATANQALQAEYQAQLEQEIRRQMAENQIATQSTAIATQSTDLLDISESTEISLPATPSLSDFDTSIGN